MPAARLLDVLVVIVLLVYLGEGWRNGFLRSLAAIVGLVAGAAAAFFSIPLVGAIVPDPFWRTFLVVSIAVAFILLGAMLGGTIGRAIQGRTERTPLRPLERFGGALLPSRRRCNSSWLNSKGSFSYPGDGRVRERCWLSPDGLNSHSDPEMGRISHWCLSRSVKRRNAMVGYLRSSRRRRDAPIERGSVFYRRSQWRPARDNGKIPLETAPRQSIQS